MKIAIIGAGFTGLSAAYYLSKSKINKITLFEKTNKAGGLASGFYAKQFAWDLEQHYHHIFTSDKDFISLAEEVNCPIIFRETKSSNFYPEGIVKFDSPLDILRLRNLDLLSKVCTVIALAYLKLSPFWMPLERISAEKFIKKVSGEQSWQVLWMPLFEKKFGSQYKNVPASWFWARIKKRSKKLGYPRGGFLFFANKIAYQVRKNGAEINFDTQVTKITRANGKLKLFFDNRRPQVFDSVICTLNNYQTSRLVPAFSKTYKKGLLLTKGLGAINLVLSLKTPFLRDGSYWLNINDLNFPFLAVVEHTNFMNKSYYGNTHIIYIGNYLPYDHKYLKKTAGALLKEFMPYLAKINPNFSKENVVNMWVFRAPLAQPIVSLNHSRKVLPHATPFKNLYLVNMQQVYPWDRGTNYAIQLGQKIASSPEFLQ